MEIEQVEVESQSSTDEEEKYEPRPSKKRRCFSTATKLDVVHTAKITTISEASRR